MRRALAWIAACVACGPQAGVAEGSGSGSDTEIAGETTTSSSSSSESSPQPGDTGTTTHDDDDVDVDASSSSSTGEWVDPCLGHTWEDCPSECEWQTLWRVIDSEACAVEYDRGLCMTPGDWPGISPRGYHGTIDGVLLFSEAGFCGANSPPQDWLVCQGTESDPAGCRCFCNDTGCPSDADWLALDECGWDEPCPPVFLGADSQYDPVAAECIVSALRDRLPGRYEAGYFGNEVHRVRLYVDDDGTRRVAYDREPPATTECPYDTHWGTAQLCELQPTSYFEDCLVDDDALITCVMQPEQWTTICAPTTPSC